MSIDRQMDKDVVHIYNGVLLSQRKERNNATCSNIAATRDYHVKWSKSEREREISYYITYVWYTYKGNAKECSNHHTIALISHTRKAMLKILQARLQQYMNFQMFKMDLEKAEEPEIKLPTSAGSSKKQQSSRKLVWYMSGVLSLNSVTTLSLIIYVFSISCLFIAE